MYLIFRFYNLQIPILTLIYVCNTFQQVYYILLCKLKLVL